MRKIQIIADSTCDLIKEDREKYNIDYFNMVFTIDDKTYDANLDWKDLDPDTYYNLMVNGKRSITGLIRTDEVEEKLSAYFEKGFDVFYISCSSKLSGSINNAKLVAADLQEKYPDAKAYCFDSLRSNYAQGLLCILASKLASEGKSLEEIAEALREDQLKYQTWATVGDLTYMKKAGRVKASTAFFGNLFGVKPIIVANQKGANVAIKKTKGRKKSLDELVSIILERIELREGDKVYIEHAICEEDANYIAAELKNNGIDSQVSVLGPIIGATCGPQTITVNFYGKKIDFDGEE